MLLLNTRVLGFFPGYAMVTLAMTLNMILKVKLPQVSFSKGKQQSFITDLKKKAKNCTSIITLTLILTLSANDMLILNQIRYIKILSIGDSIKNTIIKVKSKVVIGH